MRRVMFDVRMGLIRDCEIFSELLFEALTCMRTSAEVVVVSPGSRSGLQVAHVPRHLVRRG